MCSVRLRYNTVVAMASTVIAHGASPFPSSIHSSCCWNLETARKKWRSRSGNVRFQPYLTVSGSGTFQQFQRRRRRRLSRRNLILAGERDHKFIIETVVCVCVEARSSGFGAFWGREKPKKWKPVLRTKRWKGHDF